MKKVSWLFLLVCLVVGLSINLLLDESHNSLDEKLIGYPVSKGSYVITDEGRDSCKIFGYVDLENQENFLKGKSYEKGKEGSVKVDINGKVRYNLPPGRYNLWTEKKGRIKEFESKNPLNVIELGYETSEAEKEEMLKRTHSNSNKPQRYSTTLVVKEETPQGTLIKAVQPDPYESIEDALKRPDVEEYLIPKLK